MAELYYAFVKNNVVQEIAVFASQDEELADRIALEKGYDDAVWVGEDKPDLYSSYDGETFTKPTLDFLYEIGIAFENTAMRDARILAAMEEDPA
jgi:hypothetical protein